jgi:hypothetical protein
VKTVTLKQQTKANKELGFLELEVTKCRVYPWFYEKISSGIALKFKQQGNVEKGCFGHIALSMRKRTDFSVTHSY